ncbi:MAG: heavy-metal-associated domain-containing protein [Propionivibrio sp.]|jgi:copper chaperone|uniref:Heavy-metal-associated domain-containing protein n=1 Tax=Candidatus Propionivibrio dominans TaxID=2954373 RepID=A0A9D7F6I9_9RHOO|nr:heavy-metal-associated domain-containing protein [Candidatus Propionivibrio dominans]MBL0167153.1 heavy-metal-associated domain-containing protein [Propionivibrio sp.]
METIIIRISGMKDEECVRLVANAIQDLPSIGHLEVSLDKGEASVEHGRFVSPDDILQAIVDAGYEATC